MTGSAGQSKDSGESAAKTQTFGELAIDDLVIRTPRSTISIPNIARVEIWWEPKSRSTSQPHVPDVFTYLKVGAPLAIGLLIHLVNNVETSRAVAMYLIALLASTIVWMFVSQASTKSEPYKMHWLSISTSDGVRTSFASEDVNFVERAWYVLTERMNAKGHAAPININFEKGTIENLNVASAGSVSSATHISGTGHTVATNGATAVAGNGHTVQTANGANGRVGTIETTTNVTRSPGAQVGNGHSQNGAAHANHEIAIDFSHYLPAVVDMHRFYSRQPDAQHLEQRLHELELLMRAGAAGQHQKSRIRELSGELSHILQAYPAVTQIFQHIAGLAM